MSPSSIKVRCLGTLAGHIEDRCDPPAHRYILKKDVAERSCRIVRPDDRTTIEVSNARGWFLTRDISNGTGYLKQVHIDITNAYVKFDYVFCY